MSLADELVVDAFPYQILGPGHLERLEAQPPDASPIGNGMVELRLGAPSDWIPEARDTGRRMLAACLVTAGGAQAIMLARREGGASNLHP